MTIFMYFQWLTGRVRAGFARFASALSQRTWVVRGSLSNRQVLKERRTSPTEHHKSCKIHAKVVLDPRITDGAAHAGRRRRRLLAGFGLSSVSPPASNRPSSA